MTFNSAYRYAMKHSGVFRRHDAAVKRCVKEGGTTPGFYFAVSPDQVFYYHYDEGVQKGECTPAVKDFLVKAGMVRVIL